MDVLIYLRGILADLVVADLNPDQTPSLLNNPPDLEMSRKVMHSLTDIPLSHRTLCISLFTYKPPGALISDFHKLFYCGCCLHVPW